MKIKGKAKLQCYKNGELKWDTGWGENIVVNDGIAEVVKLIGYGLSGARFRYLAVGTSDSEALATQEALVAEITTGGLERAEATITQETDTITGDTLKLEKSWTASDSHNVNEIGAFTAASNGKMLGRKVLSETKSIVSGEILKGIYEFTFERSV